MKYICTFFIIFLLGCNKIQFEGDLQGYYYRNDKMELFQFSKRQIVVYDFLDSTSVFLPLKIQDRESIIINRKKYHYKNYLNDSILIESFGDENKNISLKKIDFNNFNLNDLNKTEWGSIKNNNKSLIRFKKDKGVSNFIKFKNEFSAKNIYFNEYKGKFFNKFHFFGGDNPFFLMNKSDSIIKILGAHDMSFFEFTYRKLNKEKNDHLIGSWLRVNKNNFINIETYSDFISKLNKKDVNYSRKLDSLNYIIDYDKIEFSKNGFFIRKLKTKLDSLKIKYTYDYSSNTNHIFIDNPFFSSQYFQIQELSKDTLIIEISNPRFIYEYIRK